MSASAALLLLCTLAFMALAILVFIKGRVALRQHLFGAYCIASVAWSAAAFFIVVDLFRDVSGRVLFGAAAVATPLLFLFLLATNRTRLRHWQWVLAIPGGVFGVMSALGYVVERAVIDGSGNVVTYVYGSMADGYGIVQGFYAAGIVSVLFWRLITTKDRLARAQLYVPTVTVTIAAVVLVVLVLVYPLVYGRRIAPFGLANISLLFVAAGFSYSIVRHRYLDVSVIARSVLVYVLVVLLLTPCIAAVFLVLGLQSTAVGVSQLITNAVIVAFTIAILFPPARRMMEAFVDRWFFKAHYHYRRDIKGFIKEIGDFRLVSAEEVEDFLAKRLKVLMGEQSVFLYLIDGETVSPTNSFDGETVPLSPAQCRALFRNLNKKEALISGELRWQKPDLYAELEPAFQATEAAGLLPLHSRGELLGFIALGGKASGDLYSAQDVDFLTTIAGQAAVAVDNAQLFEEVLVAKEYTESVLEQMTCGLIVVDLDLCVRTVNERAAQLLKIDAEVAMGRSTVELPQSLADLLIQAVEHEHYQHELEIVLSFAGSEIAPQPMRVSTAPRTDRGQRVGVLMSITDVSEVAALRVSVRTDRLTGVPNRLAFEERIKEHFERLRRYGTPCALGMVDVDNFKRFNDTYGHVAGDHVLRMLANHLMRTTRTSDFVARYGGEEFVVVFADMNAEAAQLAAERIRYTLEAQTFVHDGRAHRITASIGVAEMKANAVSWTESFQQADAALYEAKAAGRNCVQRIAV